ncbi:MAG: 30S ribosomal protein S16 [Chloroflexi bacterium]|nr:30S ribosomal protein S16 [Chloroflexota bacterium]
MVKIRLRRVGAKGRPSYRVVVADSHFARDGRALETIGHYNPLTEPETVTINKDRASEWLKKGAQPTDTVRRLLAKMGVIEQKPIVWPEKKQEKPEAVEATAETKAEAKVEAKTDAKGS